MKSKSMVKIRLPSSWPMGRVVMHRPVRWKGTFHQWLPHAGGQPQLADDLAEPMQGLLASRHSARGIGGATPAQDA